MQSLNTRCPCSKVYCQAQSTRSPTKPQQGPSTVLVEVSRMQRKTYTADQNGVRCTESIRTADALVSTDGGDVNLEVPQNLPQQLATRIRALFLPRGYPGSVTPDYLPYQLWSLPVHITGWMSVSLATSNLLQAVGVSAGAAGTTAAAAAIKWITKDGIGALGRVLVGGRLSTVFDEDPKRWRMNAEFITTSGLALEIATGLFPAKFLLLAGAGNFAKAFGKGVGRPAFRVIQTHFAARNNVGDVAAKEEVWEVVGQLTGLACSVALLKGLQALEPANGAESVLAVWLAVHSVHVVLRWKALSSLTFPYPNQKRAAIMAMHHVEEGAVPGVLEVNEQENLLVSPRAVQPRVQFGVSLQQLMAHPQEDALSAMLPAVLPLYSDEQYVLLWHEREAWVLLKPDVGPRDYLRAMWQATWLEQAGVQSADATVLQESMAALQARFDDFCTQAAAAGWDLDSTVVPITDNRLLVMSA